VSADDLLVGYRRGSSPPKREDSASVEAAPPHAEGGEDSSLLDDLLPLIRSVVGQTARRHLLSREQHEDFRSYVFVKLLENGARRIKEFRNESSFRTFLIAVIKRLYSDHRVQQFGKWRTSAAARRGGDLYEKVEELVYRDGYTAGEAHEYLTTNLGLDLSQAAFDEILANLPTHFSRRLEPDDGLEAVSDDRFRADASVRELEAEERSALVRAAWKRFYQTLSGEDQLIWALHFDDDVKPGRIAEILRCPVRHVYARVDRIKHLARKQLAKAGLTPAFLEADRGDHEGPSH
jgi:RNA polymerase sigma factor (sigma-70 family)